MVFGFHLVLQFFLSFDDGKSPKPQTNLTKIFNNYFYGSFIYDFIPLIPFQLIEMYRNRNCLFYLVKVMRLWQGFKLLDVPKLMGIFKSIHNKQKKLLMDMNPKMGDDIFQDHNKVEQLLFIGYFIKTFKLVIIIFNFSYFFAIFWIIVCKGVEDFVKNVDYTNPESAALYPDTFLTNFGLVDIEPREVAIIVTYFAFTSLSTVGFGDYHPISDIERCIGAMILLSGVAVFSYIMGNFIEILD